MFLHIINTLSIYLFLRLPEIGGRRFFFIKTQKKLSNLL